MLLEFALRASYQFCDLKCFLNQDPTRLVFDQQTLATLSRVVRTYLTSYTLHLNSNSDFEYWKRLATFHRHKTVSNLIYQPKYLWVEICEQ